MQISMSQMSNKPHKIGKLGDSDVYETVTKGGLVMIATGKGDGKISKVLGVGPHKAVARAVAQKREKDLQITALTKSQQGDTLYTQQILPEYISLTARVNGLLG